MAKSHKYDEKLPLHEAIRSIKSWMFCDSRVELDLDELTKVVTADVEASGRDLCERDCEQLVIGDDEGDVPEELQEAYPKTHAFLASHF